MGNVLAATSGISVPPPSMSGVPPPNTSSASSSPENETKTFSSNPQSSEGLTDDMGPGSFEDLHRKCKDVFPVPFEGAKLLINKGLNSHFQIYHSLTMSSLQTSGYKFGCTYVGEKQFSPNEAFPVLMGDIDPSGNVNANIIHQFTRRIRTKMVAQIQGGKWAATQFSTDFRGQDFTASVTVGNPDIVNESGVLVSQYLQNVTKNLMLGAELLYQYGPAIPGNQFALYTLAGKYSRENWQLSCNFTPLAGGVHSCYYHKVNPNLQIGVELEGSLRTQECSTTLGYQLELPTSNLTFRGQVDTSWCVGAVMEKKLLPLPFTFALSGWLNHAKHQYRFGVGFIVG